MISLGSSGVPQLFFSTHNALRLKDEEGDDKLWILVTDLDAGRRSVQFTAYPFHDVEMVKRQVIRHAGLPAATNITELQVFFRGSELPNHRSLATLFEAVPQRKDPPHLRLHWSFKDGGEEFGIREVGMRPPPRLATILAEVELAFQRGVHPKLTMDGTGGTYFLDDCHGTHIAIFKAADEEPFAPLNPRGFSGVLGQKGFRQGVRSGEGSQREYAAFLLDAQYGNFARVPQTTKIELKHPALFYDGLAHFKAGSFQEYVSGGELCGDYDSALFAVGDVHRIAMLDMQVLNLDRNDCNVLVRPRDPHVTAGPSEMTPSGKLSRFQLVPIDHGLILPDTMDVGDVDFVWFYWPQSRIPFSSLELRHIFSLDPAKDALRLARKLEVRPECLRTMRVATTVLQIGAKMHLNAFQIASYMVRTGSLEDPSHMEQAVQFALAQTYVQSGATGLVQNARLPGRMVTDLHTTALGAPPSVPSLGLGTNEMVSLASPITSETPHISGEVAAVSDGAVSGNNNSDGVSVAPLDEQDHHSSWSSSGSSHSEDDHDSSSSDSNSSLNSEASSECTTESGNEDLIPSCCLRRAKASVKSRRGHELPDSGSRQTPQARGSRATHNRVSVTFLSEDCENAICCGHSAKRREKNQPRPASPSPVASPSSSSTSNYSSGSSSEDEISAEDEITFDGPVSRISGVPLVDDGPYMWKSLRKRRRAVRRRALRKMASSGAAPSNEDSALLHHTSSFSKRLTYRPSVKYSGTLRQRTNALALRGTAARNKSTNASSTWSLQRSLVSSKSPDLDWTDPAIEHAFFAALESVVRQRFAEIYPDWQTYPFHGEAVVEEFNRRQQQRAPPAVRRRGGEAQLGNG